MSSSKGAGSSLCVLKYLSLSGVIQQRESLGNELKDLDDRQGLLEKQKDDMLNINKVFRNWLTHLQKVSVCLAYTTKNAQVAASLLQACYLFSSTRYKNAFASLASA